MKQLQNIIIGKPAAQKYLHDEDFRASASLAGSFALNLLYAAWEIICGVYCRSYWFITLGFYYILLMSARLLLLRELQKEHKTLSDKLAEWKKYRSCGILLLLLNFVLSGIVVLAVKDEQGSHYPGYMIYAMATYTFYKVALAIKSLVKYRRRSSPVLVASKAISFVSAMISLLSLEIAMILRFGADRAFFQAMTIFTGTGVCVIITGIAVYMILTAQKILRSSSH